MSKSIRDLESHIHNLWAVKQQVNTLLWRCLDHPDVMTEDEMANHLMSIEYALDLYTERLFHEFKMIAELDEYAPDEVKELRAQMLQSIYKKKKKKKTDDDRC